MGEFLPQNESVRAYLLRRNTALKSVRSTWDPDWKACSDFVDSRRAQWTLTDTNQGGRRNRQVINPTALIAKRILQAGMMSGISPKSRPWHRLTLRDRDLANYGPVRSWLNIVEQRQRNLLSQSNVYRAMFDGYGDMAQYGVAAVHTESDPKHGIRGQAYPIGTYCLAQDSGGRVTTCYRELVMTIEQIVEKWGLGVLERCSKSTQDKWRERTYDAPVQILHVVEPRKNARYGSALATDMPFRSCWLELSADEGLELLHEGGYRELPIFGVRWDARGSDVYSRGFPGIDSQGDAQMIQTMERRKLQMIDKTVNPPMGGPASAGRPSLLPGDFTAVDSIVAGQKIEPLMLINPVAITEARTCIAETRQSIREVWYADLFLSLSQTDSRDMTAREVAERHEEKMIQLGPVFEAVSYEFLDPLITRSFYLALRRGEFPEPPEELDGEDLQIEYISIVAQAQKLLGVSAVERLVGITVQLAQIDPSALKKVNVPEVLDSYADFLGVNPDLIRSKEEVEKMVADEAKAQQAQAVGQNLIAGAGAVKDLAGAQLQDPSMLSQMLNGMPGVPVPPAPGRQ